MSMKKIAGIFIFPVLFFCQSLNASVTEPVPTNSKEAAPREIILNDVVATDALREFRSLSRVDRKARMSAAKTTLREFKAMKAAGQDVGTNTVLLAILAILLPPLAVGLHEHALNGKFWLSVLLTLLFWLPGVIYALIVVLS